MFFGDFPNDTMRYLCVIGSTTGQCRGIGVYWNKKAAYGVSFMTRELKSKTRKKQRGQGMTEYIIIVALVAIGAIFVVTVFGDNIRALFGSSANALQGESTSTSDLGGQEVGDEIKRDLKDFHELGEAP